MIRLKVFVAETKPANLLLQYIKTAKNGILLFLISEVDRNLPKLTANYADYSGIIAQYRGLQSVR